jgi:hypothetical protein
VPFFKFCRININLDDLCFWGKLWPIETSLLETQSSSECDYEITLLYQDIAASLTPSIWAAEKHRVV